MLEELSNMAFIRYELVYREGAAANAPVSHVWICDTGTDLNATTPTDGDLAFVKSTNRLMLKGAGGWGYFSIITDWHPNFVADILIHQKGAPTFLLDPINYTENGRVIYDLNALILSNNMNPSVGSWVRDNDGRNSMSIFVETNRIKFFIDTTQAAAIDDSGRIYERARATAMGEWIDFPFAAGNFWAHTGGGTWTVTAQAVLRNRYALVGKVAHWSFYISWFSGGNTLTGTVQKVGIGTPFGSGAAQMNIASYTTEGVDVIMESAGGYVVVSRRDAAVFTQAPLGMIVNSTWETS